MLPRFFHRITGNETGKSASSPKSTDFRILERKLQEPCAIPICLPLDFLKAITHDFSEEQEIGKGGYGVVYKGDLENGMTVAVKKLSEIHLEDAQFHNEVTYLIGLKHKNIVQLIGYCAESRWEATQVNGKYVMAEIRKRLLCFEYLNNKSLDKHLSGLKWNMRYEIIKGICCGLHYLHTECHIVHLDLKPENILLDDSMVPKIADFGMSRLFGEQQSRIITESRGGTRGYMAPEYLTNGLISTKSDIFSLGVIIIEFMTGSREYPQSSKSSFEQFIEDVVENWRNGLEKPPRYIPMETKCQQVHTCILIALNCVDPDPKRRPSAWDIIQMLNTVENTNMSILETEIDTFSRSCSTKLSYSRMDNSTIFNTVFTSRTTNISSLFTFSAKGNNKGNNKMCTLAFDVASTIVKCLSMMNILSKQSMKHLKKVVLRSVGITRLVLEDHNQLLLLVEADIRTDLRQFSREVSRLGDLCTDPIFHNLDRYFNKLAIGCVSSDIGKISNEALRSNIQYLTKLEKYTRELRGELLVLDICENGLLRQIGSAGCERDQNMIQTMRRSLKHQRSIVKNFKNKSLWSKKMEDIVEKLVDIVYHMYSEIGSAFLKAESVQSLAPMTNLRQTLGPSGLALLYANVILQINTLVLTPRGVVRHKARDALYQALPPCIKAKLRDCCRRENTTMVAEARAEMNIILQWLVPVAESTRLYYKNGAFGQWTNMVEPEDIDIEEPHWLEQEERQLIAAASARAMQWHAVSKIQTLYYADKERTEAYILDLIQGLHRLVC